jgi:hypothetical protein
LRDGVELRRYLLRPRRRAHLGEEAMRLAQLALAAASSIRSIG